jgi:hypothetical protein
VLATFDRELWQAAMASSLLTARSYYWLATALEAGSTSVAQSPLMSVHLVRNDHISSAKIHRAAPESPNIPDWAKREREADLHCIADNSTSSGQLPPSPLKKLLGELSLLTPQSSQYLA